MTLINLKQSGVVTSFFKKIGCFLLVIFLPFSFVCKSQSLDSVKVFIISKLKEKVSNDFYIGEENYRNNRSIEVDSVFLSNNGDTLVVAFNKAMAEMPFREGVAMAVRDSIREYLPDTLRNLALRLTSNSLNLDKLVPNFYRSIHNLDNSRLTQAKKTNRKNLVTKQRAFKISKGLKNSNIAMWHSHGWYYEPKLDRWEWQRPRLFTTLEDISPAVFVVKFIAPMLENAGATVFLPRERDWQENEVIVDNNGSSGRSKFKKPKRRIAKSPGFAVGNQPYTGENPFKLGTSITFKGRKKQNNAGYIPDIPVTGEYAVYVSYGKAQGKATYRVHHTGGTTDFTIDQRMGYGTWIYLDKFHFKKGVNKKKGKVELVVPEGVKQTFSADAVRFGGGTGVIKRNGKTSGRSKYFEGARYYMQYAGAPDTLVWKLTKKDDYKDDYRGRGEWVNWLMGAPFGPKRNRQHPGLKIPVDISLAFHTDAGILPGDEIVGTLGIYSTDYGEEVFPDGQSKYASRDLSDLIQTQLVTDINKIYKCNWTRRALWNLQYSEAFRPQVPALLLELLSHQNFNDVKYLLHPKFKFDASRSIYKGMLRFISSQNGLDYIVQPLPVDHLKAEFVGEKSVKLSWLPVADKLEPTAIPEKYVVYQRIDNNGFDNGTLVGQPEIIISHLEKSRVYGFKVTAVNAGGESFPSEILSVGKAETSKGNVLIVNGFDRIDRPAIFDADSLSGVLRQLDHGVAYHYDIATTGDQYDFVKKSKWLDDDCPGHGASYADLETTIFRGNTFDFSYSHGKSILAAGYSFVTCSDEAVEDRLVTLNDYTLIDLLYGEEKTTYFPGKDSATYFEIYTKKMLDALEGYTKQGGSIFISGAYIGTDISKEKEVVNRVGNVLGFKWRTDHAVKNGEFYSVNEPINFKGTFNTDYCMELYPVEAPDGIEPFDKNGQTIFRYNENNVSAGVIYNAKHKVIALGFPFESIKNEKMRDKLMRQVLDILITK